MNNKLKWAKYFPLTSPGNFIEAEDWNALFNESGLPRTTERPARECGDEPRSNSAIRERCIPYPARLERGECSGVAPVESRSITPQGQRPKATDVSPWYGVYCLGNSTNDKTWMNDKI